MASLTVRSPLAVGGHLQELPLLECRRNDFPDLVVCQRHALTSATVTVDDPTILEASVEPVDAVQARLTLTGLARGSTLVHVTLNDDTGGSYALANRVEVRNVTQILFTPRCGDSAAAPPYLYPTSSRIQLLYELRSAGSTLFGDGVLPVDGGAFVLSAAGNPYAEFLTPATPQRGAITSPVDPSLNLELETYDLGQIDTVAIRGPSDGGAPLFLFSEPPVGTPFDVTYAVGGRAICGRPGVGSDGVTQSPFNVTYTVTSSGPCALTADGGTRVVSRSAQQQVFGQSEGLCVVSAEVDGGTGRGVAPIWFRSPLNRSQDRWTYDNPTPLGGDVFALGGSSNDLWAGDEDGALHHWLGSQWRAYSNGGPHQPIFAIWSSGSNDAWAGGVLGSLYHWDGTSWSWAPTDSAETILGIWGRSFSDVWAVGTGGLILHYDGARWSRASVNTRENFSSIWGTGTSVWIGSSTGVFRWNGSALSREVIGAGSLGGYFVAGTSSSDVWATGDTTYHWDGNAWQPQDTGGVALGRLAVASASKVWAVGAAGVYEWSGSGWSLVWAQTGLVAIYAGSVTNAWAAGRAGVMARWNGAGWADATSGVNQDGLQLTAIGGSSSTDIWAVGRLYNSPSGVILHRDAPGWSIAATNFDALNAVWSAGPGDAWAAGDLGTVLHLEGGTWTAVPSGTTKTIRAIWGSGPNDVWFAGAQSILLHWDGQNLTKSLLGDCPLGCGDADHSVIWGTSSSDVWVGGTSSWAAWDLWHYNGQLWTARTPPPAIVPRGSIRGIFGTSPSDIWFSSSSILHFDGTSWFRVPTWYEPGPMIGFSAFDVWAGNLHWNGMGWTIFDTPSPLGPLWGPDGAHVWSLGRHSSVLRRGP